MSDKNKLTKAEMKQITDGIAAGLSRKQLLESIARVTEDIGIDKRAGLIEQEIAKKFKEGKMEKPPKPKPSMTLKGGKLEGVKEAPEERRREKDVGGATAGGARREDIVTINDRMFIKKPDGTFEEVKMKKNGGSVISMKEGGVPTEYKGFSMLPEAVQQKMDPELAKKYKKGGSVNKKTGIKRRITIKGMGIAKRGF